MVAWPSISMCIYIYWERQSDCNLQNPALKCHASSLCQHQRTGSRGLLTHGAGDLHPLIAERIRKLASKKSGAKTGKYVLYWMSTAIRDHENPALDVASLEAKKRKLPLIIASFLLGDHTYPTHRRYKFILEGLRDVQTSFREKVCILSQLSAVTHCTHSAAFS